MIGAASGRRPWADGFLNVAPFSMDLRYGQSPRGAAERQWENCLLPDELCLRCLTSVEVLGCDSVGNPFCTH